MAFIFHWLWRFPCLALLLPVFYIAASPFIAVFFFLCVRACVWARASVDVCYIVSFWRVGTAGTSFLCPSLSLSFLPHIDTAASFLPLSADRFAWPISMKSRLPLFSHRLFPQPASALVFALPLVLVRALAVCLTGLARGIAVSVDKAREAGNEPEEEQVQKCKKEGTQKHNNAQAGKSHRTAPATTTTLTTPEYETKARKNYSV